MHERESIAAHEAGYAVAARILGIPLRPTRLDRGLRRYGNDVMCIGETEITDPNVYERCALVMLAGQAALQRHTPTAMGDNDLIEARNLIFECLRMRYGVPPKELIRGYTDQRCSELATEANRLVLEHWREIEAESRAIGRKPARSNRKPSAA
jgi:hypothetical protein